MSKPSKPVDLQAERVVGRVRSAVGRSGRPFEEVVTPGNGTRSEGIRKVWSARVKGTQRTSFSQFSHQLCTK